MAVVARGKEERWSEVGAKNGAEFHELFLLERRAYNMMS